MPIPLQCTATCGRGYQMRAVKCVSELLSAVLDDRVCRGASRPSDRQVRDSSSWIRNKKICYGRISVLNLFHTYFSMFVHVYVGEFTSFKMLPASQLC